MTPQEKEMLDMHFKELTKHEETFLKGEGGGQMNENGAWAYKSCDGNHLISLDLYLVHYKSWLIYNGIVKEVD